MNFIKRIEFTSENIIHGLILGAVLSFSSAITLFALTNSFTWSFYIGYTLLALAAYLAAGILLIVLHRRKRRTTEKNIFHNAGGFYIIAVFAGCLQGLLILLPGTLSRIVGINLIVLFFLWLSEYLYLKKAAKRLNSSLGYVEETLVIELPDHPGSIDDIYFVLTEYCSKNHILLEVLQKDLPGIVLLDQKRYYVKKSMDYSMVGLPAYALIISSVL